MAILDLKSGPGESVIRSAAATQARKNLTDSNMNLSQFEQLNGIGVDAYGGIAGRKNVNSFLGQYDKYYKSLTGGRSRFDGSQINNRMFNQLMIMDRATQGMIQPFIKGRFIFVPGEMARCMELIHPEETEYVRVLFQSTVVEISGFQSRQLETAEVTAMTEQNNYAIVTKQTGASRELTFKFMTMYQGLPLYKYITTWMQYIYNAGSSAAIYPHYTGLEYHEGNHSMNGVYCVVDPSFQLVEDGALIYAMVPLDNGGDGILNQTWGDHSLVDYSVRFKVHMLPGGMPQVLRICQGVLADYVSEVELNDYWVNPANEYFSGTVATNTMGLGAGVLNEPGRRAAEDYYENVERRQ